MPYRLVNSYRLSEELAASIFGVAADCTHLIVIILIIHAIAVCCFSSCQCLNTRKVSGFLSSSAWMMKYKLIKLYTIFFSPGKLALSQGMKMFVI
jgi:hypothetical protein